LETNAGFPEFSSVADEEVPLQRRALTLTLSAALLAATAGPLAGAPATETAVFAGGCFWSQEKAFEAVPGVTQVVSGFSGGHAKNPSYEQVESESTGHAESVEVTFDPSKVTYEKLLYVFWRNIDPTQVDGQFCDHGPQYRSVIFYKNDAQKTAAEESKRQLEEMPKFKGKIATAIQPASAFYPAEAYHQGYYKKNPFAYNQYRIGCGRDRLLNGVWGAEAGGHK
jgi:peptide-methionine (S)-S-oxide reductase